MSSRFPPRVTLGGVALDLQAFTWPLRVGAQAGRTEIEVHHEIGAEIERMMLAMRPLDLEIETDVEPRHSSGDRDIMTVRIVKVYVTRELQAENRYVRRFQLADWRYLLEGRIVGPRAYNLRRRANDRKALEGKRLGQALPGGSPADFETVAVFRYLPHSLRDKASPIRDPKPLRNFAEDQGTPWTALAILADLLRDYSEGGTVDLSAAIDSGYQPEQLQFREEGLAETVNGMLAASRNSMFVSPGDGVLRVFGLDETPVDRIFPPKFPFEGSGWPIKPDNRAVRHGKHRAYFVPEHEIRFNYEESTAFEAPDLVIGAVPPFDLENVLPLPETVEGIERGTLKTIPDAIELWNRNNAKTRPIGDFATLTLQRIRENYLTSKWDFFALDFDSPNKINQIWARRMAALKQHYRRTFRLKPAWMDRIESWRPELVTVGDSVTHQRLPGLVLQDYCVIPSLNIMHHPDIANDVSRVAYNVTGWQASIEGAPRVPAVISVVDEDLGVFTIDFYEDMQRNYAQVIPSRVDDIPLVAFEELGQARWETASLSATFQLSVLISVIFAVPARKAKFYAIDHAPEDFAHGEGNPALVREIVSSRQNAAYRWTDSTEARLTAEGVEIKNAPLENREVLDAIAKAEAERFYWGLKDRPTGVFILTGWEGRDFWPAGSVRQITITFSEGGLATGVDMTEPPDPPDFQGLLPPAVRRFLYKQIHRE